MYAHKYLLCFKANIFRLWNLSQIFGRFNIDFYTFPKMMIVIVSVSNQNGCRVWSTLNRYCTEHFQVAKFTVIEIYQSVQEKLHHQCRKKQKTFKICKFKTYSCIYYSSQPYFRDLVIINCLKNMKNYIVRMK